MANQPPQQPSHPVVDIPELPETFADSIDNLSFDGQTLRITFTVNRMSRDGQSPPTTKRFPSCRLILSPTCAQELGHQMAQLGVAIEKARSGGAGRAE
jgi:hypothetical protein